MKTKTYTPARVNAAVDALLEYHKDVIATDPEAAFYAQRMRYALAEGFLEGPDAAKIIRQGELCAFHLNLAKSARELFAEKFS